MVKEKSQAQLAVLERFKLASQLIGPLMPFFKIGYKVKCKRKKKLRPHNFAVAQVFKGAIVGEYPDLRIDYASVLLSDGHYPSLVQVTLLQSENRIELRHTSKVSLIGTSDDDLILWVMFCPVLGECISVEGIRSDECFIMAIPQRFERLECHHYLMVCRRDYGRFSKSVYLGRS